MGVIGTVGGSAVKYGTIGTAKIGGALVGGTAATTYAIGKPIVEGAISLARGVGTFLSRFASGFGTSTAGTLRISDGREAVAKAWGSLAKNIGTKFAKRDAQGNLQITKFGKAAVFGAALFAGSRDVYTEEKARRMGEVDQKPTSLTPSMAIPQYEFAPKKRMGALDGGASGDLVFALRNNR